MSALRIPQNFSFSTRHIKALMKMCDSSYAGEIHCYKTGNVTKNDLSNKDHRFTGFNTYYAGPKGCDPSWGYEGLMMEITGVCYRRRLSLACEKGVEFILDGPLFLKEPQEESSALDWGQMTHCPICSMLPTDEEIRASQKEERYKSEGVLREILETALKKKFPNVRPDWLINPDTGKRLEIDCYCAELSLGFEYQGAQHYRAVEFFGGEDGFLKQKRRDEYKRKICKENNITLIEVDGRRFNHDNAKKMKKYILNELKGIDIEHLEALK